MDADSNTRKNAISKTMSLIKITVVSVCISNPSFVSSEQCLGLQATQPIPKVGRSVKMDQLATLEK